MSGKLVTAVIYDNRPEAEVCVSMLEAYGICALATHMTDSRLGLIMCKSSTAMSKRPRV